jgi:imidazoleglycerol phosphate synthase glutamine amidotransferase subunit HisH
MISGSSQLRSKSGFTLQFHPERKETIGIKTDKIAIGSTPNDSPGN